MKLSIVKTTNEHQLFYRIEKKQEKNQKTIVSRQGAEAQRNKNAFSRIPLRLCASA